MEEDRCPQESEGSSAAWRQSSRSPSRSPLRISLEFTGEAAAELADLMSKLKTTDADSLALKALGLLASAKGKEIILRDPLTGDTAGVDL
jgi:hypothetical protein